MFYDIIVINEVGEKISHNTVRKSDGSLLNVVGETIEVNGKIITEDIGNALIMLKPVYVGYSVANGVASGGKWTETATKEELEANRPSPINPPPTIDEQIIVLEEAVFMLLDVMEGLI